ncbi:MAG: hypothetical protein IJ071_06810, partial [Ruminococcus sp.]|nr:hypothetical protein [Ruminococcus sp.]
RADGFCTSFLLKPSPPEVFLFAHQCRPARAGRWAFTANHRADCYAYSCESQIKDLVRSLTWVRPYVFSATDGQWPSLQSFREAGRTMFAPTIQIRPPLGGHHN